MSSQSPSNASFSADQGTQGQGPAAAFGANEWLVDEIYQQYLQDRDSVDRAWWDFFADYKPGGKNTAEAPADAAAAAPAKAAPAQAAVPAPAPAAQQTAPAAPAPQAPAPAAPPPKPSADKNAAANPPKKGRAKRVRKARRQL
ncbi:multifunctional oxoglutarate decarboxylase/oxoglutarate dehydrogenase thiamine pyrophosphate-binding subunit/dihydrolipoyllysine-residue succinyltransferase subunit, partial [Streptomyces sp. NPDC058953]